MIKAIIFDLDGIIADSEPLHFEAHKKALKESGIDLTMDDYLDFGVAKGDGNLYKKISEKNGIGLDLENISKRKKEIAKEIFTEKLVARAGILDLIDALREKYVLAIASSGSKESVKFILEKLGIGENFKVVVTGDDVEKVKPHPAIYEKAVKLLGLTKEVSIAIEDSEVGVASAKAAGLQCIAVPCNLTQKQNFSRADLVVKSPEDITEEKIQELSYNS